MRPSVVNNFAHSCLRSVQILLNGRPVIDSAKDYHYKAYFLSNITFGSAAKESWMTSFGWCDDVKGLFDEMTKVGHPTEDDKISDNIGYTTRQQRFMVRTMPNPTAYSG